MPASPSSKPKTAARSCYGQLCFESKVVQNWSWGDPITKPQAAAIAQQAERVRAATNPSIELN